jgi:hypothetical protein
MSHVYVAGLGAVSPAGWGVASTCKAVCLGSPLADQQLERPGWGKLLRARLVPNPPQRPAFLAHPRLRRASPITHYAAAAALEAWSRPRSLQSGPLQIGVVACLQAGCVNYSCRFFGETLKDPQTASPLLFPETVYAAPASHVTALLENVAVTYTLVGDPGCYLEGIALAAQWLAEKLVDVCIVFGAEETNWILADALRHLDGTASLAAGAGALCLCRDPGLSMGVELAAITDAHTYSAERTRADSARAMRRQLPSSSSSELLCDGRGTGVQVNAPETAAWGDWRGMRLSPKRVLGEGLMAGAAWQCVIACEALAGGQADAANVSIVGSNQQAIGARFLRTPVAEPAMDPSQKCEVRT